MLTAPEREFLHSLQHSIDESDYDYTRANHVIVGPVTKEHRKTIKSLRLKGFVDFARGGMTDEGRLIGGTFYGITKTGRAALRSS